MPFTINDAYTIGEVLKSYDPQGKLHHIIDVFSSQRPIMQEAFWAEANDRTSHEMLRVLSKPSGANTEINTGYAKEGVATVPVKEQLATLGSRFELDKRLAKYQKNPGEWRAQRAKLHILGMMENWNLKFWRDSEDVDPKNVNGLLTRYNSLSLSNVKGLSGSANLYPVVIVKWGLDGVMCLYPQGGETTFTEDDRGEVELTDSDGLPFPGYRSYFNLAYGIGVADDRAVQRLVNVDVTAIKGAATFEEALIERVNELPNQENAAIYCGRQVITAIEQRINSKSNMYFTKETIWGRTMPTFMGLPIIRDDSLSVTESVVS